MTSDRCEEGTRDRMVGGHVPGCRKQGCKCYGANDSRGRKDERRKAKRRERQRVTRSLRAYFGRSDGA